MKRCSILRVIKKCKSKPQWDTTSQFWAIIKSCYLKKKKKQKITRVIEGLEKLKPLGMANKNVKWCSGGYGNQYGGFPKNKKIELCMIQQFYFRVYTQKNYKQGNRQIFVHPCL